MPTTVSSLRSSFLATLLFTVCLLFVQEKHGTVLANQTSKPNIVFILADDLGWTDLGTQGSKYYETPNIDRLATNGLKLTKYHNCQNCQPTRAALMTGQYAPRTGVYTVGGIDRFDWRTRPLRPVDNVQQLPLDKVTIAQQLKKAGYATAMFGKWHLGQNGPHHPARRGFDEAIVSMGAHINFVTHPPVDVPQGAYLADWLTDKAVDFISRNKHQPFFLYLPHFGVHSPLQAKRELEEKFAAQKSDAQKSDNQKSDNGHSNPTYAAMIYSVDESVGRVVKTLQTCGIADNTVVIFSSDNGGVGGYVREGLKRSGDTTDNAPLRSGKGSLYEGGTRVPFIVQWPGVIRPGSTSDQPSIHVDVFPTLLELANAPKPDGQVLDGESLVSIFRDSQQHLKRDAIFQHFPGYLGAGEGTWRTTPVSLVQMGDWKLLEFLEDGRKELYNLRADVGESRNLVDSHPEKASELFQRLSEWRSEIKAPMPTPNVEREATNAQTTKGKAKDKTAKDKGGKDNGGKRKAKQKQDAGS